MSSTMLHTKRCLKMKARMTNQEFFKLIECQGHTLRRVGGEVDAFVLNIPGHYGPGCVTCGATWCSHCSQVVSQCPPTVTKLVLEEDDE